MSDQSRQMTPEEAAEFAEQVFNKAREGDAAMMAALLTKGLPPNLRNHKGDTLLMLAAYHGHVETVKVLLEHKADPEIRNDNGQSPIAGAAFKGDLAVVTALVDGGAQVEGSSFDGRTALMMAAMFNRVAIVDYLISKGADPKPRTPMACRHSMRRKPWALSIPSLSWKSCSADLLWRGSLLLTTGPQSLLNALSFAPSKIHSLQDPSP